MTRWCRRSGPARWLWVPALLVVAPALAAPPADADAPVDPDLAYRVGAGDVLEILVPGYTEQTGQATIARDGTINIGLVENLKVEGLTPPELEQLLTRTLADFLRRTEGIRVRVAAKRMTVRVAGNVTQSGELMVPRDSTVQAVLAAAQPLPGSILTDIRVRRRNGDWVEELSVDLKAYREGRTELPQLQSGDEVFVRAIEDLAEVVGGVDPGTSAAVAGGTGTQRGTVEVLGAVQTPGRIPVRPDSNLFHVLLAARYVPADADLSRVRLVRGGTGEPEIYDLQSFIDTGAPLPPPVAPGDVITVPSRTAATRTVMVRGMVARSGPVPLPPGANLQDAVSLAGGPLPDGNLREIILSRVEDGEVRDRVVDLQEYIETGNAATLPELLNGDVIHVPRGRMPLDPPGATVEVRGAVAKPGLIPLAQRRSLQYAMTQAGPLPTANLHRITIVHTDAGGEDEPRRVVFDLQAYLDEGVGLVPELRDGDIVTVDHNRVQVTGAVTTQGQFPFEPRMNLLAAMQLAGGPKPEANLRNVTLTRQGPTGPEQTVINLEAYVDNPGSQPLMPELRDGDVILVPIGVSEDRAANVVGEVGSPGPIDIVGRQASIITVIQRAGSIRPTGDEHRVRIIRPTIDGRLLVETVDFGAIVRGQLQGPIPQVKPGDIVRVDPLTESQTGILVLGAVSPQGYVPYSGPGMTLRDVFAIAVPAGNSALDRIRLIRADGSGVLSLNINDFTQDGKPWPEVYPGDFVAVDGRRQGTNILEEALRIFGLFNAIRDPFNNR